MFHFDVFTPFIPGSSFHSSHSVTPTWGERIFAPIDYARGMSTARARNCPRDNLPTTRSLSPRPPLILFRASSVSRPFLSPPPKLYHYQQRPLRYRANKLIFINSSSPRLYLILTLAFNVDTSLQDLSTFPLFSLLLAPFFFLSFFPPFSLGVFRSDGRLLLVAWVIISTSNWQLCF